MTICRNPNNSPDSDSRITKQLGYKHTFYQNVVFTKNCLFLYFRKCWSIDDRSRFFLSHAKLYIGGLRQIYFSIGIFQTACSRSFINYGIE
jgi:hypothetical protein